MLSPKEMFKLLKKVTSPGSFFVAIGNAIMNSAKGLFFGTLNKAKEKVDHVKDVIKKIKMIVKMIVKIIVKAVKILAKFWQVVLVLAIIVVLIVFIIMFYNTIMEALGGFRGVVSVDIGKMQEMNQDTSAWIDIQNKEGLMAAFYEDVSSSSFYQTFNLRDMNEDSISPVEDFLISLQASFMEARGDAEYAELKQSLKKDLFAQRKTVADGTAVYTDNNVLGFSGLFAAPQLDTRFIYTDANKNPVRYLKQAELIGTTDTRDKLNAYFRDYYNRESTFLLSPTLLYDLNEWAYGDFRELEKIVYPEAFTKPIAFVNDYRRIQTDPESSQVGKEYVYVTQRVTLDDIRDRNSEFFNRYDLEGLIYSTPSNVVWDYAIVEQNRHQIKKNTDSAGVINIGNVSKYAEETGTIVYGEPDEPIEIQRTGEGGVALPSGSTIKGFEGQALGLGDSLMVGLIQTANGALVGNEGTSAVVGAGVSKIEELANNYSGYQYVVISAGTNNYSSSILNSYKSLLNTVAERNPGAYIICLGIPWMDESVGRYSITNAQVRARNSEIQSAVSSARSANPDSTFEYIDSYSISENKTDHKANDGLHMSNAGYSAWWTKINSSLSIAKSNNMRDNTSNNSGGNEQSGGTTGNTSTQPGEAPEKSNPEDEAMVTTDSTTLLVPLYWKVNDDCVDRQLGVFDAEDDSCEAAEGSSKCFIGPYLTMEVGDDGTITLSDLITDETEYAGNVITREYNKCPRKHLQTASIFDENDKMLLSSRNLFNKSYIRQKTVKPSYRNSDTYWSQFADFVMTDLDRSTAIYRNDRDAYETMCSDALINEERALAWENRKCSIIRHYMADGLVNFVDAKIIEGLEFLENKTKFASTIASVFSGTEKEVEFSKNITPEAMYRILMEYEDYLVSHGTHGVEWEYRYFATSDYDRLKGVTNFTHIQVGLFGATIPDFLGIKALLQSQSQTVVYKDTYKYYLESNDGQSERSLATEYVPVAVVSQNSLKDSDGNYYGINNVGWGWKVDKNSSGNEIIKLVKGEASLQFPYYSEADDIGTALRESVFGEVVYGENNFTRKWENGKIVKTEKWSTLSETLKEAGVLAVANYLSIGSDDMLQGHEDVHFSYIDGMPLDVDGSPDIRNDEYVWNPEAEVWRPAVDVTSDDDMKAILNSEEYTTTMKKCTGGQCGRVATTKSPTDYLPMEVKSVRDYGLGSVLSYIESRKVVFKTGIGAGEDYNIEGVKKFFQDLNAASNGTVFNVEDATKGFYPLQLLDSEYGGLSLASVYRTMPEGIDSIEELNEVARAFLSAQGTGAQSVTIPGGKTCTLEGGFNASQYIVTCDGKATGLYAFVPHFTEPDILAAFKDFFGSKDVNVPDQFWDPMGYYLAWFDYSQEFDPANIWSKAAKILGIGEGFSAQLDTAMAATLRNINENNLSFKETRSVSTIWRKLFSETPTGESGVDITSTSWFWGDAGLNVSEANRDTFFSQYSGDIRPIDLIDESQTQRLYLIEEAATFLGEFLYTYEDRMETIGQMVTERAIINDVVWADRYYYLSNLIFQLGVKEYKFEKSTDNKVQVPSDEDTHEGKDYTEVKNPSAGATVKSFLKSLFSADKDTILKEINKCTYTGADVKEVVTDAGTTSVMVNNYDCTTYKYYYTYNEGGNIDIKEPDKVIEITRQLEQNGAGEDFLKKIWLNTKVYANLSNWAIFHGENTADISFGYDYSAGADNGKFRFGPYTNGGIFNESIKANLSGKTGFAVEAAVYPQTTQLVDGKVPDESYKIITGTDGNAMDAGAMNNFGDQNKFLNSEEIKKILDVIVSIYSDPRKGYNFLKKIEDGEPCKVDGETIAGCYTGKVMGDSVDDLAYGVSYADRADEGYPLPLFEHLAGEIKEIMAYETASYFNGETLDSYRKRVAFKESDGFTRYNYLVAEREERTSYLYDYLMNFEAYVPLDVKEDGALEVRGYDSLLAVRVNYNSKIESSADVTAEISASMVDAEWKDVIGKFQNTKLDQKGIEQLVAGAIEVSIKRAPAKMIYIYNKALANGNYTTDSGSKILSIENSSENKKAILDATKKTVNFSANAGEPPEDLLTVELSVQTESGPAKQKFYLMTVGPGAIEYSGNIVFKDGSEFVPTKINSSKYGSSTPSGTEIILDITFENDERLSEKGIAFTSKKLARQFNKWGNAAFAAFAFLYGDEVWNQMSNILANGGTTLNWQQITKDQWAEALNAAGSAITGIQTNSLTASDIDTEVWSTQSVTDILSYISDADARTDAIQTSVPGTFAKTDNIGQYTETAMKIYEKWKYIVDPLSGKYGVDRAFVVATWANESRGSAFAGICGADNVTEVCPNGSYDPSCKAALACATSSRQSYNGGGGVGQIHDIRGTGGTGSGAGNGGGGGWDRCLTADTLPEGEQTGCPGGGNTCCVTIHNPKRELSGNQQSASTMYSWMQRDTRFDPEVGGEWSIIFLANLVNANDGDLTKAAVAYNAGPGRLKEYINNAKNSGYGDDWYSYYKNVVNGKYWEHVSSYYSTELATGSFKYTGGTARPASSLNTYKNTAAYNSYETDKLGVQNTGIELRGRSMQRVDVDMVLTSATRNDDPNARPYEYDIFDFFNPNGIVGGSDQQGTVNGDWIVSAGIAELGGRTEVGRTIKNEFTGVPPLFRIGGPGGDTVKYKFTSSYGYRTGYGIYAGQKEHHNGVDLVFPGAGKNPNIYAVAPGVVSQVWINNKDIGNAVNIDHSDAIKSGLIKLDNDGIITNSAGKSYKITGIITRYFHMRDTPLVKKGDSIEGGQQIGVMGTSGNSSGVHLHFEIRMEGVEVDAAGNKIGGSTGFKVVDPEPWLKTIWYADESHTTTLPGLTFEN